MLFQMKIRTILIHLLIWIAIFFLLVLLVWLYQYGLYLDANTPRRTFQDVLEKAAYTNLMILLDGAIGFYLSEYIILKNKKLYWFGLLVLVPVLVLLCLSQFSEILLRVFRYYLATAYVYMSTFVVLGVLSAVYKKMSNLKTKNLIAQLELVRSKTNPHFLFNTINNIDSLITRDPERASSYLNKLSNILRFMLYESGAERIPLQQEINYIVEYINLEKIRSINPDFVQINVHGDVNGQQVAPMTFIPVLENAFKHLSSKTTVGAITLDLQVSEQQVVFSCKNIYNNNNAGKGGLGTGLMKRRLDLIYGHRSHLEVKKDDQFYEVIIKLDLDAH
jgi:sensor histidine kinase YesM